MAVQQNKKSPSKRGMHRSHNALTQPGTAIEPTTGEVHLRHHISPTGFYRGRKVLKTKADASAFDEEGKNAQRAYNKALFEQMRKLDSSLEGRINSMEALILKKLNE